MAEPAKKRATSANVLAAPPVVVAEIINGVIERRGRPLPGLGTAVSKAFAPADRQWQWIGTRAAGEFASLTPFGAVSISLADLWPLDRPLGFAENPQHLFAGDR